MKEFGKLFFIAALIFGLAFGDASLLRAQSAGSGEFTLEEITVTAQKREENLQKVATTMEVITGADIQETAKNDLSEILSSVANVIVNQSTDGLRVSLRGMVQDSYPWQGLQTKSPTVALNTDGVYSNRNPSGQNMFDIERVEVLYGPQSTMYASASPGGIVNIITSNPKLNEFEGSGTIEYGNYSLLHFEGVVNAALGDKWAIRTGFTSSVREGYLTNGADDENSRVARVKVLYQPNDKIGIVLTGEEERSTGQGFLGVVAFVNQDDVDNPWESEDPVQTPRENKKQKLNMRIDADLGIGDLVLLPSWSTKDSLRVTSTNDDLDGPFGPGTEVGLLEIYDTGETTEKGFEARMTSKDGSFIKWIAGANYYKSTDISFNTEYANSELTVTGHRTSYQKTKVIYANVTYPVTDTFRLNLGSRYTWDINEVASIAWNWEDGVSSVREDEGAAQKYNHPDFKAGVEYDLAENSMLYADWSSSYRTNGGTTYQPPEELKAYTVGMKNRFFANKFQANISAYFYDYTNKFALAGVMTVTDANGNGIRDYIDANENGVHDPGEEYTENQNRPDSDARQVGDQEIYGVDLQTSTILTSHDEVDLSVSYNKKTWTRLYFDYWDITNSIGIPDLDYSGKTSTYAPTWNVQLTYSHNFLLPNDMGTITARLESKYQSEYRMEIPEYRVGLTSATDDTIYRVWILPYIMQEGYTISNFSAIYANSDGNLTFTAYVKNITNYAVKRAIRDIASSGVQTLMLDAPRTYGVVMTIKF